MSEQREPTRWCDDPAGLPSDLVQAMRGYQHQGPADPERARMRRALEKSLPGTPISTPGRLLRLRRYGTLLGLVLGVGAVVWQVRPAEEPVAPSASEPAAPSASEPAAPRHVEHAPAPPLARSAAQEMQQARPPAPEARAHAPVRPQDDRSRREAAPMAADPGVELELLRRARRVLDADPARALALTDEHAQRFAQGVFVQERELIAIEALARHEQSAEARARAARFRKRFRGSVHLERLRMLLGPP